MARSSTAPLRVKRTAASRPGEISQPMGGRAGASIQQATRRASRLR